MSLLEFTAAKRSESQDDALVYSEQIGESLLANRELAAEHRRRTFRFYI